MKTLGNITGYFLAGVSGATLNMLVAFIGPMNIVVQAIVWITAFLIGYLCVEQFLYLGAKIVEHLAK